MTVRITGGQYPLWYHDKIGQSFSVDDDEDCAPFYYVRGMGDVLTRYIIRKEDCRVLSGKLQQHLEVVRNAS